MTCIIGHRDGWMVADRRISARGWIGPYDVRKIAKTSYHDTALVGVAGTMALLGPVHKTVNDCGMNEEELLSKLSSMLRDREDKQDATFLVLTREHLIEVDPAGGLFWLDTDLWAIGDGAPAALGYLRGMERGGVKGLIPAHAEEAIAFSGKLNTAVGDGTQVETLKKE
jgi:ATP-dependent protease HslVU (ClpYQ) peptidase subunit